MPKRKSVKPAAPAIDVVWLNSRIEDLYGTTAALSKLMFGHKDVLARCLAGERALKAGEVVMLAERLRITAGDVLGRLGYAVGNSVCPVVGIVNKYSRVRPVPGDAVATIHAPVDASLHGEFAALRVDAVQGHVPFFHRTHLFFPVQTERFVHPASTRFLSVIEVGELDAAVVGVLDSVSRASGTIRTLAGEEIETTKIVSAVPVRWVKIG